MTYIDKNSYLKGREAGIYPKNGPVPEKEWKAATELRAPIEMTTDDRKAELHRMLALAWDHPHPMCRNLYERIFDLTGGKKIDCGGSAQNWARHLDGKPVQSIDRKNDRRAYQAFMTLTEELGREALRPQDLPKAQHQKHVQWLLEEQGTRAHDNFELPRLTEQLYRFLGSDSRVRVAIVEEAAEHAAWMKENPSELPPQTKERFAYDYVMELLKEELKRRK